MTITSINISPPVFEPRMRPVYKVDISSLVQGSEKVHDLSFSIFYPHYVNGNIINEWDFTELKKTLYRSSSTFDYIEIPKLVQAHLNETLLSYKTMIDELEEKKPAPVVTNSSFKYFKKDNTFGSYFQIEGSPLYFELSLFLSSGKWTMFDISFSEDNINWSLFKEKPSLAFEREVLAQVTSLLENDPGLRVRIFFDKKK